MMAATNPSPDFADVVGVNVRSRMLQHLADSESPKKQHEIAEELGVSQASVSRATHELLDSGVIQQDSEGRISAQPDTEAGVGMFREAIKHNQN